jgi:hypothetical protein
MRLPLSSSKAAEAMNKAALKKAKLHGARHAELHGRWRAQLDVVPMLAITSCASVCARLPDSACIASRWRRWHTTPAAARFTTNYLVAVAIYARCRFMN